GAGEPRNGRGVPGGVDQGRLLTRGGVDPGRALFWRKPLGPGVIATAAKHDVAPRDALEAAVQSMLRLNRVAAEVALESDARGATDITGFGFLGHAAEMAQASGVGLAIRARDLPVLPGALALAEQRQWSGGMGRNRRFLESSLGARGRLQIPPELGTGLTGLLFESEPSGGL